MYRVKQVAAHKYPFELFKAFHEYYNAALRLRSKYQHQIHIPIGFEVDYIRESSIALIRNLQSTYKFDFFVGSVHHVHTIPIDFDEGMYQKAMSAAGGTEEHLFEAYFDAQFAMLEALKPAIVGHFDLIRLFCADPTKKLKDYGDGVWERVERNVNFIVSYGGLTELNSSSIRKGWDEPYPRKDVCEVSIFVRICWESGKMLISFFVLYSSSLVRVEDLPCLMIAMLSNKLDRTTRKFWHIFITST